MRYILFILLLSSCSAQWYHEKACAKDSVYCGNYFVLDTFVVRDTFTYHFVDTTKMVDTILIDTGSVRVQIIREHDIIRTTITQKPDTTYITITKILPPNVIYRESWFKWWYLLIIFAIFVIIIKWIK